MNQELTAAVRESREWLEQFNRRQYAEAFRAYAGRFGPAYRQAVREAGEDLNALAADLLDQVEADWAACRVWKRGEARGRTRQMLALYLTPMLLELEEPDCRRLAELLREAWAVRRPRETYQTASHQEILSGFRDTIMGIEIRRER